MNKVNDIRRIIFPLCMLAYIFSFMIASAGAVCYTFKSGEGIYAVAGVLNGVFGILNVIRLYKNKR